MCRSLIPCALPTGKGQFCCLCPFFVDRRVKTNGSCSSHHGRSGTGVVLGL